MKILPVLLAALFALSMSACSDRDDEQTTQDKNDRLFDTQRDALEKAQQVEGMIQDAKEQRDKAIEEQTSK